MNDDLSAGAPDLIRRAKEALRAYWNETPGWRSLWSDLLEEWAADIVNVDHETLLEVQPLALMLIAMADAFADAEASISHPLLTTAAPRSAGSPKANSAQRARRRAIATLAAFYLARKKKGVTNEKCFEEAAQAVRQAQGTVTANEIKAAWHNRHGYSADDRAAIEDVRRMSRGSCIALGADLYVEAVAFYTQSPIAQQPRGGRRR